MKNLFTNKLFMRLLIGVVVCLAAFGFTSTVAAQSICGATYTVKRGDYLMNIARTCGVSYSDLLKANPLITNQNLVFAGQVLKIPGDEIPPAGSQPGVYTVQPGDTLFKIRQRFNLSAAELLEANPAMGSTIKVGQVLNIPARIKFAPGGTAAILQGHLAANSQHDYLLSAGAGRILEVTLSAPSGLTLAVLGADGSTLQSAGSSSTFRGTLPKTQDYILVLASGGSALDYSVSVAIPLRIQFASGGTSVTLTGTVPASLSQFFSLRAVKGQTLNVTATPQDKLQLIIYGMDGSVLRSGMGEGASFSGVLPGTQDYILVLKSANQVQNFTLKVTIPAASTPPVSGISYIVKSGDTLFSIALRFQTTLDALLRANPQITRSNLIFTGQRINIP
jgi:LysM repeat protein